FADSIEEAIRQARQALGPDAMLVNSKRSGAEARHLGAYEVVICAAEEEVPEVRSSTRPEPAQASPVSDSPSIKAISQDVSELRRQMERLAVALARSTSGLA